MDADFIQQARAYKNELIAHLFGRPETPDEDDQASLLRQIPQGSNIVGVGFGHKMTQGTQSKEEPVIRIYVKVKLPLAEIAPAFRIPPEINGIETDVIEVGTLEPFAPCGVSVSHQQGKPGTIGCLVRKTNGSSNADFILSCNHVLANSNRARMGDFIVQPAISDGGTQVVAQLSDFQPLNFTGGKNFMDAAIAQVFNAGTITPDIKNIGRLNPQPLAAQRGQSVIKNGRTTGFTQGIIRDPLVDMSIPYPGSGFALLEDHILIDNRAGGSFSLVGDSGSLVVESTSKRPLGLLAAGGTGFTLASPIAPILARFQVRIV